MEIWHREKMLLVWGLYADKWTPQGTSMEASWKPHHRLHSFLLIYRFIYFTFPSLFAFSNFPRYTTTASFITTFIISCFSPLTFCSLLANDTLLNVSLCILASSLKAPVIYPLKKKTERMERNYVTIRILRKRK